MMYFSEVTDSREILERLEELKSLFWGVEWEERDGLSVWIDEDGNEEDLELEADEFDELADFVEECQQYSSDFDYGEAVISDHYFPQYAEKLANDAYNIDNYSWPFNCIDWDEAAEELKQDYTSVEYQGETYWVRSS
jgi:hypothetical protein